MVLMLVPFSFASFSFGQAKENEEHICLGTIKNVRIVLLIFYVKDKKCQTVAFWE